MVQDFNIEIYDKGGMNAIAGDGKLTGGEVEKAREDGYINIWDGYTANDPIPLNVKADAKQAEAKAKQAEIEARAKAKQAKAEVKQAKAEVRRAKAEARQKYIDFDHFDIGGVNALPKDGKLTGEEVLGAINAGYSEVTEGLTKEDLENNTSKGRKTANYAALCLSRACANSSNNNFLYGVALLFDVILLPYTMPITFAQKLYEKNYST